MHTHLTASPLEAAAFLRDGQPVAFPTETVYGLGVSAFNEDAIRKVFEIKGRPPDNPLIVHVGGIEQIARVGEIKSASTSLLIERFFPGPLTVVLEKKPELPSLVTARLQTVAVRMPSSRLTLEFLHYCEVPVAAPSANLSGRPSPTTWQDVLIDFEGRIPCILQGPQSEYGLESTVIDCTTDPPVVLRPGAVTLESLCEVAPGTHYAKDPTSSLARRSPGTRHRHYSPHARVRIVEDPRVLQAAAPSAYIGIDRPEDEASLALVRICADVSQYAFDLYHFFRTCDRLGLETIYCQRVEPSGLGRALMDRVVRAADAAD